MNKIFRFFVFTAIAVSSFSFASCGSDDDDEDSTPILAGNPTSPEEISGDTWVLNYGESKSYSTMNGISGFSNLNSSDANGLYLVSVKFYADGTADCEVSGASSKGTYSIDGKEFTCSYDIVRKLTTYKDTSSTTSDKTYRMTMKKGADLAEFFTSQVSTTPMYYTLTQHQISKLGNKLYITMTVTASYNEDIFNDEFIDGAYESAGGKFGDLIKKTIKSDKYTTYYLVYDKK